MTLGALFLICFGLPFFLLNGCQLGPSMGEGIEELAPRSEKLGPEVFQETYRIGVGSAFYSVNDGVALNPSSSDDFLLITWFKLQQMPRLGKRTILLSKFDEESPGRPGYAIALFRDSNGVRPMIFWQSSERGGRWLSFAEMRFRSQHWLMLALSFHDQKYLGLHGTLVVKGEQSVVELLGGYEFDEPTLPDAETSFRIGSVSENSFRGQIGAVTVLRRERLTDDLRDILEDAVKSPLELPGAVSKGEVQFWSLDGAKDLGPLKLEIISESRRSLLQKDD